MHKLLLADDSVTIQRVIELTFSGEDVQVTAVNDGEQAIARIPLERPDVVLADIGMPRKGGYDVSAFVKGRPDLAHIPVLLLAGAFEPVDQARAEQVKADGVLIKPFEPRQVIERVKELLALAQETRAREAVPQAPPTLAADPLYASTPEPVPAEVEAEPLPVVVEPDTPVVPIAESEPAVGESPQSLDELFESLNQAFNEPLPAAEPLVSAAAPSDLAPDVVSDLESEFPLEIEAAPETFVLEPPVPFEPLAPASNGATLEDYFDRLSAAFEQANVPPPRTFPPTPGRLEDMASPPPAATAPAPESADEWPAQEWLSSGNAPLSFERRGDDANPILEAVTALLTHADDTGTVKSPAPAWQEVPAPQAAAPSPSQAIVDAVTERVLARLVPEVTESLRRLVQQEVARANRDVH